MRIAVTGGTGLLGNNVIRAALDAGHEVRALSRSDKPQPCFDGLSIELVVGDLADDEAIGELVAGTDAVVHSAGLVVFGWSNRDRANAINGTGAGNVARAARLAGSRLVHVSTTNTLAIGKRNQPADETTEGDGQVPCTYVTSKRLGDQLVREQMNAGLDGVIVHPGFMLGPWDWKPSSGELVVQLSKTWSPVTPMGGVCLCDVRDVAAGVLAAIDKGKTGRNYLLGGENWTHFKLWKTIAAELGRPGPWTPVGPFGLRMLGGLIDVAVQAGLSEPKVNGAAVRVASQCHFYDSRRAAEELGFRSRPGVESIRDSITWFRERQMIG